MGGSGKWIKSLIGLKKSEKDDTKEKIKEKEGSNGSGGKQKKWSKLWRSSSADLGSMWRGGSKGGGSSNSSSRLQSEASDTCSAPPDPFTAAVATVVRAPPKDFLAVRQEWAAIRIQTAFRAFLARRALRALRGVVRLQALVRGRQVRKQAAVTFRCMQALVRVQARIRARRVRLSSEGQAVQQMLQSHRTQMDAIKEAEERWCDSQRTLEAIRMKLHMRHEGAMKRERALAYALSQQCISRSTTPETCSRPKSKSSSSSSVSRHQNLDKTNNCNWSWLERWMVAKPWESRLMDEQHQQAQAQVEFSSEVQSLKASDDYSYSSTHSRCLEPGSVKIKKNNVSTRISAKPPPPPPLLSSRLRSASSPTSADLLFLDETSPSSSSNCTSTPISKTTLLTSTTDHQECNSKNGARPNYMNLTHSIKAKQKACNYNRTTMMQRNSSGEFNFHKKMTMTSSYVESRSSDGSDPSSIASSRLVQRRDRSSMRSAEKENYYCN